MIIWPGKTSLSYQGLGKGRALRFREEDAAYLKSQIPLISEISPEYSRRGVELKQGKNTYLASVRGVYPVYAAMRNVIPRMGGRFLDDPDLDLKRRSIFIGGKL